jgi:hypothetical protein
MLEFALYIGTRKAMHAIRYTYGKCACTRLSRTKRRYNLDKIPNEPRWHRKTQQKKWLSELYNIIK